MNELMYMLLHGWRWTGRITLWGDERMLEIEIEHRQPVKMWHQVVGVGEYA